MTLSVQEARAQLQNAQVEAEKQKRAKAMQDLSAARTEGRKLDREIKTSTKTFHEIEAECARLQGELIDLNNTLNRALPEFPTDEQLRHYESAKAEIAIDRKALLIRLRAEVSKREHIRQHTITLGKQLDQLRYSIRNLEAVSRGEKIGGGWEGGVNRVSGLDLSRRYGICS